MAFLFGPSRRDQVHLLSTLQSLNPASVAGLAAALSWSERKTEKVVREVAGARESIVAYDPIRRMVSIRRPGAAATLSASISGGVATAPTAPLAPPPPAPNRAPTEDGATPRGAPRRCPTCHVPLLTTASAGAAVCPQCGRFSSVPRSGAASVAPPTPPEPAGAANPPAPVESGRTVVHAHDRRSQELFAAWVTARPIPCPRCRTSLRHRGVGEYGCPSCGHRVVFETSVGGLGTPRDAPAPNH